jgi:pyruvate dehydrogenase E1 component beta subunit
MSRRLTYAGAINEALHQVMESDPRVFLMGQGTKSPWYVGKTAEGLLQRFGASRVMDTPVSENGMTGAAVGAAISGMRPVVVHPRMDFMLYAFDPIVNEAANWRYMSGGRSAVPVVFWGIINRGGEQAAQHSQALHALFSHVPGLKVVMPSTPHDAKGLMIAAIRDSDPVVFIDDRWLYGQEGDVPEGPYEVPIGKATICRDGSDLTIAAISYMVPEALEASAALQEEGIDAEVVDMRTAKPLDEQLLLRSVTKTGRLVVADVGWKTNGLSAEISAVVGERAFPSLKSAISRVALPDLPAPASRSLERVYFPRAKDLVEAAKSCLRS